VAFYIGATALIAEVVVSSSFTDLEESEANKDMVRFREAILAEADHLDTLNRDWSAWDALYEYTIDQENGFTDEKLTSPATYTNNRLSVIAIYNAEGETLWSGAFDYETGEPIEIAEFSQDDHVAPSILIEVLSGDVDPTQRRVVGAMATEAGPMLVSYRPILTSQNEGPVRGAIVMGRLLDDTMLSTLSEQTHVDALGWDLLRDEVPSVVSDAVESLAADDQVVSQPQSAATLHVFAMVPGLDGAPLIGLRAAVPREISIRGSDAMAFAFVAASTAGMLVLAVLLFMLRSAVVVPLERLTRHATAIGHADDLLARIDLDRNDELGTLAVELNRMVARVAQSSKSLVDQAQRAGKADSDRARFIANHDVLTGLPNRRLFEDRASISLARARRNGEQVVFLFVDVDHLKSVNDSLGHEAGDTVIRTVGDRLRTALRVEDTVARVGGDEFIIILSGPATHNDVTGVCKRALAALREPADFQGTPLTLSASIGVATYPRDGTEVRTLVRNSDLAMNAAKAAGKNRWCFFDEAVGLEYQDQSTARAELRAAIDNEELLLHYQPQIDAHSGQLIGLEAFVRWQQPDGSLLSPALFLPMAESTGMIVDIGNWVIRRACAQLREWMDAGLSPPRIAVNVSAREVTTMAIVETVANALAEYRIDGSYLELELTESSPLHKPELVRMIFERLRTMDVAVALDDFGTGYSVIEYLRRFPINRVKIDRSFLREFNDSESGHAMLRALIQLAHGLGLEVVAEGVDEAKYCSVLASYGCDLLQGYAVARPCPADEASTFFGEEAAARFAALVK
ncbi:MAG: diguanylate cyclase (GGDEF)-like protein, partial [Bradymonadia bacterium]